MKLKPSHQPLRLPSLGLDKLNLAAAALILWVALGPWIWGYASSSSAVASHVFFIFAFGPLTLLLLVLRPAALILLAAGLWLAASPWLLGYATNHTAWLSDLVTGLLLTAVAGRAAGISIPKLARKHREAATAPRPTQAAGSRS